jgi:hypothetical protein
VVILYGETMDLYVLLGFDILVFGLGSSLSNAQRSRVITVSKKLQAMLESRRYMDHHMITSQAFNIVVNLSQLQLNG